MRRIILSLILMAGIAGFAGLLEGKDIPNVPVKSLVAPVAAPEIINWILDDPAISDGWEFSSSWIGEPDQFGTVSESKNLMVSTSEFHSGNSSLMLQINHKKKGYCGGMVTTSTQNNGTPASSWEEANKGKNISGCETL